MKPLRQTKSKQSFALTHSLERLPTMAKSRLVHGFNAEMRGEVLRTGLFQRREASLLISEGQEGSIRAAGIEVSLGLQGVIDHQQHPFFESATHLFKPVGKSAGPLGGPAVLRIRRRQGHPETCRK